MFPETVEDLTSTKMRINCICSWPISLNGKYKEWFTVSRLQLSSALSRPFLVDPVLLLSFDYSPCVCDCLSLIWTICPLKPVNMIPTWQKRFCHMTNLGILKWEIILVYLSGPNVIIKVFKWGRQEGKSHGKRQWKQRLKW